MTKKREANKKGVGQRIRETFGTVKKQTSDKINSTAGTVKSSAASAVNWGDTKISDSVVLLRSAIESSSEIAGSTGQLVVSHLSKQQERFKDVALTATQQQAVLINALLASDFSSQIQDWIDKIPTLSPTDYDRFIDANYNKTHIGGGQLHRLLDGNHTPWGMWEAVKDSKTDDTFFQEVVGYMGSSWKDLITPTGLPIMTLDKESYDALAGSLKDNLNIPKNWTSDMLHFDGVELIGTVIVTFTVLYKWNRAEAEEFGRIAGSISISAIASANPLLCVVSLAVLAKAFVQAKKQGSYKETLSSLTKHGTVTFLFQITTVLVPGPAIVGVLAGIAISVAANNAGQNIAPEAVAEFIKQQVQAGMKKVPGLDRVGLATNANI